MTFHHIVSIGVAAYVASVGMAAEANFFDGESLLKACEDSPEKETCRGYVAGVYDSTGPFLLDRYCVPHDAQLEQLVDSVVLWLRAHPEQRHIAAGQLVTVALGQTFPCGKG